MDKKQLKALTDICQRYGIIKLELFGSATTSLFNPATSDYDFLVEFAPDADLGPWLMHYFELKHELEQLFERPVDIVESNAVRNPWLRREIEKSKVLVYAA